MLNLLSNIISKSIILLSQEQPNLLSNTTMTTMTEWNLGHHLSNVIGRYIDSLDCDLDCVKRNYENKRPDIIFHRRGMNNFNFLIIELKIDSVTNQSDLRKIEAEWQTPPLNYLFGACISINRDWNTNGIIRTLSGTRNNLSETFIQNDIVILTLDQISNYIETNN